jgi:hypothetical protein
MKPICYLIFILSVTICQIAQANSYTPIGIPLGSSATTDVRSAENYKKSRMTNEEIEIINSGKKISVSGQIVIKRNQLFKPNYLDASNRTNVERMEQGEAPIGVDGLPINLHHMKQKANGIILEASQTEHKANSASWHRYRNVSEIDRDSFSKFRSDYWKNRAKDFEHRGQYPGYISLGTAAAMAMGPELWNLLNTGSLSDQSVINISHAGTIIATERVSVYTLSKFGDGLIRGGIKSNAIIGLTIIATDTSLSVYEHGGSLAFQNKDFYINLGGSIGSLVGIPIAVLMTGVTGNPLLGGITGGVASAACYVGGKAITYTILQNVNPQIIYKAEDTAISDAQDKINSLIRIQQRAEIVKTPFQIN